MTLGPWGERWSQIGASIVMNQLLRYVKENMQNLSKTPFPLGIVGNSQSRLSSLTPYGKKAAASGSAQASGPSSWNKGEARESSIVAARLLSCSVCSTLVRRAPHSLVDRPA